ncbi:hypothetical protein, partial [Pseudomonas aeruginosa]|uniref:hypothetical protein n=1 Tax=Pseudomonas aeruginosa TaxID=287 RepID=UPI001EFA19AA
WFSYARRDAQTHTYQPPQQELFDDAATHPESTAPATPGRHGSRAGGTMDAAGQPQPELR